MCVLKLTLVLFILSQTKTGAVNIGITHWNDVSAQMESFVESKTYNSSAPVPCQEDGSDDSKCVGGLVNMINWLNKTKNTPYEGLVDPKNIFRINSGNFIGGESGWFSNMEDHSDSLSWKKFGELLVYQYEPDAVAFGSKEFGTGLTETLKFIPDESLWGNVTNIAQKFLIPANTCKLTYDNTTREYKFCSHNKTLILNVYDPTTFEIYSIGVISFIPPAVQRSSFPGALDFSDISTSIQEEIKKNHANITTFIAIGEGNLAIAQDILDKVPKVKLVIYSSGFEDTDTSGDYPKKYGNKFIATAGKYGSSVGKLVFDFNPQSGDLTLVKQDLSLTKHFTPLLPQALAAVGAFYSLQASINLTRDKIFGRTSVSLKGGKTCWNEECNLGNLVADALVHCTLKTLLETLKQPPTFPVHSIWDGGAFYESSIKRGEIITQYDIRKWLPYQNDIRLVKIKGSNLMKVFNISASGIQPKNAGTKNLRQFLQVSNGIEVYYNTKPVPRVTRARMIHDNQLGDTRLKDLNDTIEYYLTIPAFLYEGKGAYEEAKSYWIDVAFGVNNTQTYMIAQDHQCLISYITSLGFVTTGIDERIWIDQENQGCDTVNIPGDNSGKNHAGHTQNTVATVVLTIVYFVIIEAVI